MKSILRSLKKDVRFLSCRGDIYDLICNEFNEFNPFKKALGKQIMIGGDCFRVDDVGVAGWGGIGRGYDLQAPVTFYAVGFVIDKDGKQSAKRIRKSVEMYNVLKEGLNMANHYEEQREESAAKAEKAEVKSFDEKQKKVFAGIVAALKSEDLTAEQEISVLLDFSTMVMSANQLRKLKFASNGVVIWSDSQAALGDEGVLNAPPEHK